MTKYRGQVTFFKKKGYDRFNAYIYLNKRKQANPLGPISGKHRGPQPAKERGVMPQPRTINFHNFLTQRQGNCSAPHPKKDQTWGSR